MGIKTKIEWCDSTVNLQMGCNGCELWNPKAGVTACYAGALTQRWGGKPGWPESFDKPAVFLDRLGPALDWPDLTGKERPGKPWLNGLPRLIFLNDMGDTFTESLALDWLAPAIEVMSEAPHRWLILTKRPKRMYRFFNEYGRIPWNFWLLTSATDQFTWDARVPVLIKCREINPQVTLGVSCEPMLGAIDMHADWGGVGMVRCKACGQYEWPNIDDTACPSCGQFTGTRFENINWIIAGGESGRTARPMHPDWARKLRDDCAATNTPFFWKQWGEYGPAPLATNQYSYQFAPDPAGRSSYAGATVYKTGKATAGRLLDDKEHNQMPEEA